MGRAAIISQKVKSELGTWARRSGRNRGVSYRVKEPGGDVRRSRKTETSQVTKSDSTSE